MPFKLGSTLTALMQGYMLGQYVLGFEINWMAQSFSILSGLCVMAAYAYNGRLCLYRRHLAGDEIPGKVLLSEAASAQESLEFILIGTVIVVHIILGYTVFSYRVFWGKATELK